MVIYVFMYILNLWKFHNMRVTEGNGASFSGCSAFARQDICNLHMILWMLISPSLLTRQDICSLHMIFTRHDICNLRMILRVMTYATSIWFYASRHMRPPYDCLNANISFNINASRHMQPPYDFLNADMSFNINLDIMSNRPEVV